MEAIIDTRIQAQIQFHYILQGLCAGRCTGTANMELKISQELSSVNQDLLFLVFIGLRKAYNMVYRIRLIRNLEGYGAGPQMCNLLTTFFSHQ